MPAVVQKGRRIPGLRAKLLEQERLRSADSAIDFRDDPLLDPRVMLWDSDPDLYASLCAEVRRSEPTSPLIERLERGEDVTVSTRDLRALGLRSVLAVRWIADGESGVSTVVVRADDTVVPGQGSVW